MNSAGTYNYDIHVLDVKDECLVVTGGYFNCQSFAEAEQRIKIAWIPIRGKIEHRPAHGGGSITRYYVWKVDGPKLKIRVGHGVVSEPVVSSTYVPAKPYVARPDPVSFLADKPGLTTIEEEDVFAEKVEPYTYKAIPSTKKQKRLQEAIERAGKASARRTAN